MIFTALCAATALLLLAAALGCLRISDWHHHEARYWRTVHHKWLLYPEETDRDYMPLLEWTWANPPTLRTRLRAWQSPRVRRWDAGLDAWEAELAGKTREEA